MSTRNLNASSSKKTLNFEVGNLSKSNADSSVKVNFDNSHLLNPNDWRANKPGSSSNLLSSMNGSTPNGDSSALSRYKKRNKKAIKIEERNYWKEKKQAEMNINIWLS